MSSELDYYRILGVGREAPDRHVKKAYYELARQLHPDKAATPEEASVNADKLALISKAYNTLKDPRKRAEYDAQLKGRQGTSSGTSTPPPAAKPAAAAAARKPAAPGTAGQPGAKPGGPPAPPQSSGDESARASMMFQQKKSMAQKAFVKGMQFYKRQELREALNFFEVAVTNDPDSEAQYHLKYAQCLIRMKGSYTKAVEHASRACEMDPYNIEFKLTLGDIHEQAGVATKAMEIYEDVLRWDQNNTTAKNKINLLKATTGKSGGLLDKITAMFNKKK